MAMRRLVLMTRYTVGVERGPKSLVFYQEGGLVNVPLSPPLLSSKGLVIRRDPSRAIPYFLVHFTNTQVQSLAAGIVFKDDSLANCDMLAV